ncbi:MAG: glycosyltransferase [Paludibacteraceae bacterium]|nr:glycosyltransferase [Paludibacteraceae bacterium]
MSSNRVLHVSKFYPPFKGGIEDVCCSIVKSVGGFVHKVICFNVGRKNSVSEVENGVEVMRVGTVSKCFSQPLSFDFFFKLRKMMKSFRPEIVHLHVPNPFSAIMTLLAIEKKSKLIVHWHSDIIEQRLSYLVYRPFERMMLKRADKIFVTSPNYKDFSEPLRDFSEKIAVIPNGISIPKMEMNAQSESLVQSIKETYAQKKIVFFMGRHVPYKGLDMLLKAEPFIKEDCVVIIAGSGPLTKELKLKSNSERVFFIGEIKDEEIAPYMTAASVLAFPSVSKNEAFGIVLAEAMYCSTPPVTFTIEGSGVNWVNLNGETGLEVANGDVEAFGAAVDKLLSDEELRNRLGAAARQRIIDNFTMDKVKFLVEKEYADLLGK